MKSTTIFFRLIILIYFLFSSYAFSDTLNKIEIVGNDRISNETIKLFISVNINDEINENELNRILKDLYETNFFEDVRVKFDEQTLYINVKENPIIESIVYKGIKSNRILDIIKNETSIKSRSSYNENLIKKEKFKIINILKKFGLL